MQKRHSQLNHCKGSALIIAVVFGAIFSILGITLLTIVSNGSRQLRREIELQRAFWANESALNLAVRAYTIHKESADGDNAFVLRGTNQMKINGYNLWLRKFRDPTPGEVESESTIQGESSLLLRSTVLNFLDSLDASNGHIEKVDFEWLGYDRLITFSSSSWSSKLY